MCGTADRSSHCLPGFHRQDLVIPAVRPSCRATTEASTMRDLRTTSKVVEEFGGRNPFIPALKTSCDGFEAVLIVAIVLAAIGICSAAAAVICSEKRPSQISGASVDRSPDAETVARVRLQMLGA